MFDMMSVNVLHQTSEEGQAKTSPVPFATSSCSVFRVPLAELYGRSGGAVPQILVEIIRKLEVSKLDADRLFKGPVNDKIVRMFKGLYDGGYRQPLEKCYEVYTVAGLLKAFLLDLPKPLLTEQLVSSFESASEMGETRELVATLQSLVTQISHCERRTIKYIIYYLNRSCRKKSKCLTNSSRKSVAKIFVPLIFRKETVECKETYELEGLEKILDVMIEHCQLIFSPFTSNEAAHSDSYAHGLDEVQDEASGTGTGAGEEEEEEEEDENDEKEESRSNARSKEEEEDMDAIEEVVDTYIAETVLGSLFSGVDEKNPQTIEVKNENETTSPPLKRKKNGKWTAKKSPAKKVLSPLNMNIVKQKQNPGLEKEQRIVKPTVKPDFTHITKKKDDNLNIDDLSYDELLKEKRKIKKVIRIADNQLAKQLGRKPTQAEKEPLRPMYSRYWKIKRSLESTKMKIVNDESLILELLKY